MKLPLFFSKLSLLVAPVALVLNLGFAQNALAQTKPLVKFTTNMGEFVVELQSDTAPATVDHFLKNVQSHIYDGTIFHKMIGDFVLQGGGFDVNFAERPIRARLAHEGQDAVARGGLKNVAGTLAMARSTERNSAGNEFFVNLASNPDLDPVQIPGGDPISRFEFLGKVYNNIPRSLLVTAPELQGYTTFGRIVSGMQTIDKIKAIPTGKMGPFPSDVPLSVVVINRVDVVGAPALQTTVVAAPAPTPTVVVAAPAVASQPALVTAADPALAAAEVKDALNRWAAAWSAKNVPAYIAAYAPDYKAPGTKSRKDWEDQRTARITEKSKISLKLDRVEVQVSGDTAVAKFNQAYQADTVSSNGLKVLNFTKVAGNWVITKEESR